MVSVVRRLSNWVSSTSAVDSVTLMRLCATRDRPGVHARETIANRKQVTEREREGKQREFFFFSFFLTSEVRQTKRGGGRKGGRRERGRVIQRERRGVRERERERES